MELIADCPRCGAKHMTFDVVDHHLLGQRNQWQNVYEVFSACRHCHTTTTFVLGQIHIEGNPFGRDAVVNRSLNNYCEIEGFVSIKDFARVLPPEHVPEDIVVIFKEGATCLAVQCFNAAGTMFRLCVDMATRALLPEKDRDGLNSNIRRSLGLRMRWLFDQKLLPEALRDLSTCIREDGNDGAHSGTLQKPDVEDLLDFTTQLLERLYTEPKRLELAKQRRDRRRQPLPKTGTT